LKEETKNLVSQLGTQNQTREALQNLITALKTQITLTKEEGELKLKEETQKRIECSNQFQGRDALINPASWTPSKKSIYCHKTLIIAQIWKLSELGLIWRIAADDHD
jgi:hypothetical protein